MGQTAVRSQPKLLPRPEPRGPPIDYACYMRSDIRMTRANITLFSCPQIEYIAISSNGVHPIYFSESLHEKFSG